jgi:hypothetical protein
MQKYGGIKKGKKKVLAIGWDVDLIWRIMNSETRGTVKICFRCPYKFKKWLWVFIRKRLGYATVMHVFITFKIAA